MKYPEFLKPGGTIGFIAPSFGCATEPYKTAFENALRVFKAMGYHVWLGPNVYESSGIGISNTPEKCGQELTEAYLGEECDVILSCGGGELMCETISHTDWERMKEAKPKLYMGYSDNTNATFLLTTLLDTASVYGSTAATFGMEPWHPALSMQWDIFTGKGRSVHGFDRFELVSLKDENNPLAPYNCTEETRVKAVPDPAGNTKLRGRLLGGCLDCLVNLCGTRFDRVKEFTERYKEDGILWFLESCDLNVMSVRRALWELREAGWFRNATGFLIGRPMHFGEENFGCDMYEAVTGALSELGVPILMDLDFGHLPPMFPIVCGALGEAEIRDGRFFMEMRYE